jgi:penicillin-binding protein 1A
MNMPLRSDDPVFDPVEPVEEAPRSFLRRWWWRILLIGALLFAGLITWLVFTAPLQRALEPLPEGALVLLDAEGRPFARRGDYKERPVTVAELPPHVVDAFLSIEDRRFYDHWGIDPVGLARAALTNAQAGGVVQGGSTITQQLAKTSFLTLERSITRKLQEVIIAIYLETRLEKDEILSRYLSSVYFGEGAYGLRAAARTYFDREPDRLTVAQAAMLAGLVKAPSALAPTRHLRRAQERSEVVVQAMVDNGKLSAAEARRIRPATVDEGRGDVPAGSYFGDWVLPQARETLGGGRYGEVRVRTTLEPDLQRRAESVIAQALRDNGQWQQVDQAALVAMRTDGRVVAMVGGRDYGESQYNRAAQAKRQPGSSFKLFVYLAALRNGYTLDSTVDDTPVEIDGWRPRNDEGKYRGVIGMRTAVAASSNVAAARITQDVGVDKVIATARDLGVTSYLNPWPALSLGTSRMTLLELTSAFAAVAAGEYPVTPTGLPGQVGRAQRRPMPEADAMRELLNSAVRNGTGLEARLPIKAYGKTGTTQNFRDALFVGFAGDLVVGVWVGNDDNRPTNGVVGGDLPAKIWRRFMTQALPQLRPREASPRIEAAGALDDLVIEDEAAVDAGAEAVDGAGAAIEAAGDLIDAAAEGRLDAAQAAGTAGEGEAAEPQD